MAKPRTLLRLATLALAIAATGGAALAQSASCQRYRAELAGLGRGGGGGSGAAAQRQRAEIGRMTGYYHSLGCGDGASFFYSPPAECGAIAQRIRAMEANYGQLASEPDAGSIALRRRQLTAAISQACQPQEAAVREDRKRVEEDRERERERRARVERARASDSDDDEGTSSRKATGGSRLVCVRACDGFFFPLNNAPEGRRGADEMCKALCPGAEAAAYSMPAGDGELSQALSLKGKPYTQLANAFKFQKSVDPTCSCRKPGQSWAEALQRAEKMIGRHSGDIIVTAKKAEELSRPLLANRTAGRSRSKDRKPDDNAGTPPEAYASHKPDAASETPAKAAPAATAPVSAPAAAKPAGSADATKPGEKAEIVKVSAPAEEPAKRKVRIVAPVLFTAPETRTQ